jgi:hypothetical protein
MAEHSGRDNHPGMISPFENFQIGAAGQRRFNAQADFPGLQGCFGNVFDSYRLFAIKNGGFHFAARRMRSFPHFAKENREKAFVSRTRALR